MTQIKWHHCQGPLRGHESAETPIGNVSLSSENLIWNAKSLSMQKIGNFGLSVQYLTTVGENPAKLTNPIAFLIEAFDN